MRFQSCTALVVGGLLVVSHPAHGADRVAGTRYNGGNPDCWVKALGWERTFAGCCDPRHGLAGNLSCWGRGYTHCRCCFLTTSVRSEDQYSPCDHVEFDSESLNFDSNLAKFLAQLAKYLKAAAVLDFGSGLGLLLSYLMRYGGVSQAVGIEPINMSLPEDMTVYQQDGTGPEQVTLDILSASAEHIFNAGLAESRKFDMVMTIEAMEHIRADKTDFVLDFLVSRLADHGILIFSAAQPGQEGPGQFTERPLGFWRYELTRRGLRYMPTLTKALVRTSMHNYWNRMVFAGRAATLLPNTTEAMGIDWSPNLCPDRRVGFCRGEDPVHAKIERAMWPTLSLYRRRNLGLAG
eukprot:TRINITY_DN111189_c0_g1_i1.p1 TRINITY_DN111189_c0_g1~~TRINITY_DN111189_c0_g1_i1.p1  ORF type:complete len:357 (+),score=47.01 TRINITY_DN111189_c0_g1_i1:24-1073(+)